MLFLVNRRERERERERERVNLNLFISILFMDNRWCYGGGARVGGWGMKGVGVALAHITTPLDAKLLWQAKSVF